MWGIRTDVVEIDNRKVIYETVSNDTELGDSSSNYIRNLAANACKEKKAIYHLQ
jgi:hypothetical protein